MFFFLTLFLKPALVSPFCCDLIPRVLPDLMLYEFELSDFLRNPSGTTIFSGKLRAGSLHNSRLYVCLNYSLMNNLSLHPLIPALTGL